MCNVQHSRALSRPILSQFFIFALVLFLIVLSTACGTSPNASVASPSSNSSSSSGLSLTPSSATVASMEQLQFTARISGTSNTAVTWTASAGTISKSGFFTAPQVTSTTPVVITATNGGGPVSLPVNLKDATVPNINTHASVTVTVTAPTTLAVTTSALPAGDVDAPYSATLSAAGGASPYQWSLAIGTLPSGIQLNSGTGLITGETSLAGSYPLTARVTDASGHTATSTLNLSISPSTTGGTFDGPAELPRVYLQSAMANTPAPGSTISVNAGGDLQSALNSAGCGDTISLQSGATFTGIFTFPAKNCDDNHWIIVRTSAPDSSLPAEGTRLTPCYAGISSLPGRPAFNCASTQNVLAKLVLSSTNLGPVIFATGASYYRLIGLEITRATGTGFASSLWSVANNGTASNLIIDRVWMHGTAQDETNRGVWLAGTTSISIVDSFFTDFHCVSVTGDCTDSQAIGGGIGSGPMGPYKFTDNFLEASGENILFGGGTATATPTDIQVSQNHFFKPLTWMKGQPGYVGGTNGNPFVVKNLFEMKNAQRVLLDGNIMEDSWGGFTQNGFAVVLTPKNQLIGSTNVCPICQVTDVTVRYNTMSHLGGGLQIANALAGTGPALAGERYSIHDIVVDDIDGLKFDGSGDLAQISVQAGAPLLQSVTINHVTAFPPSMLFMIGDFVATSGAMKNIFITNSLASAGVYPIWSTGGGSTNCAYDDVPMTTFGTCFSGSPFTNNAVIGAPNAPPAGWPAGNFFPASVTSVQFVNYNGGIGGDYHLEPSSPYKDKGTDGKDLGADIDAINSAIAGVE